MNLRNSCQNCLLGLLPPEDGGDTPAIALTGYGRAAPMTKPMAKRLRNAPVNAAALSEKDRGIIEAAESAP